MQDQKVVTKTTSSVPPETNNSDAFSLWQRYIKDCLGGAMYWLGYGFKVIPLASGTKIPAVKWDPWLDGLDPQKVHDHWAGNPSHDVGFIVGESIIVFDADSPESLAALLEIEARVGITPKLVVKTKKGEHHYFRRAAGTTAKSDSHSTEMFPDRLDIKTGRSLVVLPPSTGKSIMSLTAENAGALSEATQEFIDAVYQHNGRNAPSQPREVTASAFTQEGKSDASLKKIEKLLNSIDPDCGYDDWLHCIMAVHHETNGSDEGLDIVDAWSRKGQKYKDRKDIETKWHSLKPDVATPYTIGTLIKMARAAGADVDAIMNNGDEEFEVCEYEIVDPSAVAPENVTKRENPLDRYTLLGMSHEIEKQVMEEAYVLDEIALMGQSTVIYAAPNTGKTLLCLHLLMKSIKQTGLDPTKVYYVNVDDTATGLLEKLHIAEEYGFNMLAEGYRNFKAKEFLLLITDMIETGKARGVIIFLDTLKKFTDLMKKDACTRFTEVIRTFVMQGGTVIALAHTNKNPGRDGRRVYAGTSDIVDDFDCAYILDTILEDADKKQKTVEFTNMKKRGNVALSVSYSYDLERKIKYNELLLSVQKVDEMHLLAHKQAAEIKSDADVITAIETYIKGGINTKMKLAAESAEHANVSQKQALRIIEKYTGDDPKIHRWSFEVRERGAKAYKVLERPSGHPAAPAITTP
ncbi:MAG: PriCT-2 domain-containing protein [Proteobacteria bacterium]|nr:PriCT-2 domain-containing protein [Pseudomonadota bacterium]MBU0967902.1 PriCT-2 domain-containing protein [Pseudomonadota bacterium]